MKKVKPSMVRFILLCLVAIPVFASAQPWFEMQKVVAFDRDTSYRFGASSDFDDSWAAMTADSYYYDTLDITPPYDSLIQVYDPSVYMYKKDTTLGWGFSQVLFPSVRGPNYTFASAALLGNQLLVVSAHWPSYDTIRIYVFNLIGNNWVETQIIALGDTTLGIPGQIKASGSCAVLSLGSCTTDSAGQNPMPGAGAALILERDQNWNWSVVQKLTQPAPDRGPGEQFGVGIDIEDDWLVVGSFFDDEDENGVNGVTDAGSAFVYKKNGSGIWVLDQKLVAFDRDPNDLYGYGVSIYGDWVSIGAAYNNTDSLGQIDVDIAGSVYMYKRDALGEWNYEQKLIEEDPDGGGDFGVTVDLGNGRLVIGQSWDFLLPGTPTGSASLFHTNANGYWTFVQTVGASDKMDNDFFGLSSTKLLSDEVMVTAYHQDLDEFGNNPMLNTGAVYFFEYSVPVYASSLWAVQQNILIHPNPTTGLLTVTGVAPNSAIALLDMMGRVMELPPFDIAEGASSMDLRHLPNGIYFIRIGKHTEKIILNK